MNVNTINPFSLFPTPVWSPAGAAGETGSAFVDESGDAFVDPETGGNFLNPE